MSTRGGGRLTTEKVYNFNQNLRTRKIEMQSALSRIKGVVSKETVVLRRWGSSMQNLVYQRS